MLSSLRIVSLEAYKRNHTYFFEMLALDVLKEGAAPEEEVHLLLAGSKDHALFPDLDILAAAKNRASSTRDPDPLCFASREDP